MKTLTIILIAVLVQSFIDIAQDKGPEALYFSIPQSSGRFTKQFNINDTNNEYKQDHFLITNQWNFHQRMAEALLMTSNMCY